MGEYARRRDNGAHVKIGTCEDMLYLRWEDRGAVAALPGNTDPALESEGLRFRLPFPDEDGEGAGSGEPFRTLLLPGFDPGEEVDPGRVQLRHEQSGLLLSVPCHHGAKLPEVADGMTAHWIGRSPHFWALKSVRVAGGALWPVIACRSCGAAYRSTWAAVLEHVPDEIMRDRLAAYGEVRA
jgi:hypothetical protein